MDIAGADSESTLEAHAWKPRNQVPGNRQKPGNTTWVHAETFQEKLRCNIRGKSPRKFAIRHRPGLNFAELGTAFLADVSTVILSKTYPECVEPSICAMPAAWDSVLRHIASQQKQTGI